MLSGMVMNQLVNIVISASRTKAGSSDKEAARMFQMWQNLVSMIYYSTTHPRAPADFSSFQREPQAMSWHRSHISTRSKGSKPWCG